MDHQPTTDAARRRTAACDRLARASAALERHTNDGGLRVAWAAWRFDAAVTALRRQAVRDARAGHHDPQVPGPEFASTADADADHFASAAGLYRVLVALLTPDGDAAAAEGLRPPPGPAPLRRGLGNGWR
jgi:hypothetical protein